MAVVPMSLKILCTIGKEFASEAKAILVPIGTVDYATPTQEKLSTIIGKYDAIVTQIGYRFDASVLKKAKHLRCIATATTGTDHIDLVAAKKLNITVLSLKEAKDLLEDIPSTAEHTWGLLLALIRNVIPSTLDVLGGAWNGKPFAGTELKGKTIGIIGMGRLGRMVAKYGNSFDMNVIGCDVRSIPSSICKQVSLKTLLKTSDVVSLHVHLTQTTERMIGSQALKLMKPTAVLINTARGRLVDERALLSALKAKSIAGYAADVLAGETYFRGKCSGDPLVRYARTHGNVLLTPHIGGRTAEARRATDMFIAKKLHDAIVNGTKTT